jgi:hypothetical protein
MHPDAIDRVLRKHATALGLDRAECSGVLVEMIPHHLPASWTADAVNAVTDGGELNTVGFCAPDPK